MFVQPVVHPAKSLAALGEPSSRYVLPVIQSGSYFPSEPILLENSDKQGSGKQAMERRWDTEKVSLDQMWKQGPSYKCMYSPAIINLYPATKFCRILNKLVLRSSIGKARRTSQGNSQVARQYAQQFDTEHQETTCSHP